MLLTLESNIAAATSATSDMTRKWEGTPYLSAERLSGQKVLRSHISLASRTAVFFCATQNTKVSMSSGFMLTLIWTWESRKNKNRS